MVPCPLPISAAANAALFSSLLPPALPPDRDRERERGERGRRFSPFFSVAPRSLSGFYYSVPSPLGAGEEVAAESKAWVFFTAAAEAAAIGDRRRFLRKKHNAGANSKTMEKAKEDMA